MVLLPGGLAFLSLGGSGAAWSLVFRGDLKL
jgi:hypothetical protein